MTRHVTVVTTASVPWMTGTAVNPLLRAAYLTQDRAPGMVTLLLPWVEEEDQRKVFPQGITFADEEEQRQHVLRWLADEAHMPTAAGKLRIRFYQGRYHREFGSIFSMGSVVSLLPDDETDICILEEPEHLNWFRFPEMGWLDKFNFVVGIIHTNYVVYAGQEKGAWAVPFVWGLSQWMCRAYCNKVIKLSATLQTYAPEKEVVCNVHGVRDTCFRIGREAELKGFTRGAYFVGKHLWAKGFDHLFRLMKHYSTKGTGCFPIDLYGTGPDLESIQQRAKETGLPVTAKGFADHMSLRDYKVFVNPSVTEVLCTTTAEALAMGKWVVCPKHPSNDFFAEFPSCLQYSTPDEFAAAIEWALTHDPPPLLPEVKRKLSWEAAMERLAEASLVHHEDSRRNARTRLDKILDAVYRQMGTGPKGDLIRLISGGDKVSFQVAFENEFLNARKKEDKPVTAKMPSDSSALVYSKRGNARSLEAPFDRNVDTSDDVRTDEDPSAVETDNKGASS